MRIEIVGKSGVFGAFLEKLLIRPKNEYNPQTQKDYFIASEDDHGSVILAVPYSAYEEVSARYKGRHLVNVCSIQESTTEILLKYSNNVTSIHPLFGPRTPDDKRTSILTHRSVTAEENVFLKKFASFSVIEGGITPKQHDELMARTHYIAIKAAREMKQYVDNAADIPDCLIPNSFRLLRSFVTTMEDMPEGTVNSILANPYIKVQYVPDRTT